MAAPTIVSTSPTSGAVGVPVNTTISIIFDQEIDTARLKSGGVIIEGPDQTKSIGPDLIEFSPLTADENDFLASPGYKGIVESQWVFQRVDGSGVEVPYYDYGDTDAAGAIYRTKVVLTPTRPLAALTEYTVYVIGDEDPTDSVDFGLSSRSVFDPRKGANTGNGEVLFYGGYTGAVRQEFYIEIITAGTAGTATYEWWTSTDATHHVGISSISYRVLKDGVKVKFLQGLNFAAGDTFSVWCDVPEYMDGSSKFSFTTSDQSPTTLPVPSTVAVPGTGTTASALSILSTVPADRSALVSTSLTTITVTASAALDSSTVTTSTVSVAGHAVDESVGEVTFTEALTFSVSVSGAVITITLDAGQLYANNVVSVSLASTIADTDGNALGEDYSFFFGTTLDPYYAGIRAVRLRLGPAGNYYPDETIAVAIWEASRLADAYTPTILQNATVFAEARRQFVICYAAYLLVSSGLSGMGGSVRKRLGDFDVSRSESSGSNGLDDSLRACWEQYLALIEDGGGTPTSVQAPVNVVKGESNLDEPLYGRGWEIPRVPIANVKYLYSGSRRWLRGNMWRNK